MTVGSIASSCDSALPPRGTSVVRMRSHSMRPQWMTNDGNGAAGSDWGYGTMLLWERLGKSCGFTIEARHARCPRAAIAANIKEGQSQ